MSLHSRYSFPLTVAVVSALFSRTVGQLTLTITTSSLPAATKNAPYSATLQAVGGTSPYTWSISVDASGSLPSGLFTQQQRRD